MWESAERAAAGRIHPEVTDDDLHPCRQPIMPHWRWRCSIAVAASLAVNPYTAAAAAAAGAAGSSVPPLHSALGPLDVAVWLKLGCAMLAMRALHQMLLPLRLSVRRWPVPALLRVAGMLALAALLPAGAHFCMLFNPEVRGEGEGGLGCGGGHMGFGEVRLEEKITPCADPDVANSSNYSHRCEYIGAKAPPHPSLPKHTQALFLAASALLLPLPLKHHLVVQALTLWPALVRGPQPSLARLPGRAAACQSFVSAIRLALQAIMPGAPLQMCFPQAPLGCCWMQHVWVLIVVGFMLPTAVVIGQQQHRRQLRSLHRRMEASRPDGAPAVEQRRQRPPNELNIWSAAAAAAPRIPLPLPSIPEEAEEPAAKAASARATSAAADDERHDCDAEEACGAWVSRQLDSMLAHPAAPLAHHLSGWLLLLVPAGAAVWAALELAASA